MSDETEKLSLFLESLDTVAKDYICGVCGELCNKPITLSTCCHIICSEHFGKITHCPFCKLSLSDCTTLDTDLDGAVDSIKQMLQICQGLRNSPQTQDVKVNRRGRVTISDENDNKKNKATTSKKSDEKGNKRARVNTSDEKENNKTPSEDDKKNKKVLPNLKPKEDVTSNLNSSLQSNSSKITRSEKKNKKGETALHIACRLGKADVVAKLLQEGANVNTKDNAGWTPLHEVVQNWRLDLMKLLLQYNSLIDVPGPSNETPLHEAVRYNYKDIAEELVKNGADINARNCKGETPMELASDDMKELLETASSNILHTQSVNVTLMAEINTELDMEDLRIFSSTKVRALQNQLRLLAKNHANISLEAKFTKPVNVLIVDCDNDNITTSTEDILIGIVNGIWIISTKWLETSTPTALAPLANHEIKGIGNKAYNGPQKSRYNRYKQLPGIFNGCHIYLHNFGTTYSISKTLSLTKAGLSRLITDAGGVVLRRIPNPESIPENENLVPYHAKKGGKLERCSHYIIFKEFYEPMYNMAHIKALPIGWLIECIEKYELCEPWGVE